MIAIWKDSVTLFRKIDCRPHELIGLLLLHVLVLLTEGLTLSLLLPIFAAVAEYGTGGEVGATLPILGSVFEMIGFKPSLESLLALAVVAILIRAILGYVFEVQSFWVKAKVERDARIGITAKLLRVRLSFFDSISVGHLANEIVVELNKAIGVIFEFLRIVTQSALIAMYFTGLVILSIEMTVFLTVTALIGGLGMNWVVRHSHGAGQRVLDTNQSISQWLYSKLRQIRLIRVSQTEDCELQELAQYAISNAVHKVRIKSLAARIRLVAEPFIALGLIVFLYFSVTAFGLSSEYILLFAAMTVRLMPMTIQLGRSVQTLSERAPSMIRILRRIEELERIPEPENTGGNHLEGLRSELRLDNLSYSYPGRGDSVPALNDISLTIPVGSFTALVGPSGAGKSTLIDLLPRLREPTGGSVCFDGVDARGCSLDSLRSAFSFVPQSPEILADTVSDHIRYGNPDAGSNAIREAARLANALEFIEALPQGFETRISGGRELSGGQRQRLDLARALARKADILILDEPTSQLDSESEKALEDSIVEIRSKTNLTLIVIAHRFSTIRNADQIVVMDAGRIVDIGTHDALMARGGWYAQAYRQQTTNNSGVLDDAVDPIMDGGHS